MALKIEEWIEQKEVKELMKKPEDEIINLYFFRDPNRPLYYNRNYFLSPADGIVVYVKEVSAKEDLIDVKGKKFTVQDLLHDYHYRKRSLVIGVFMTFYDVHINRMPTSGLLMIRDVPPICSYNLPMLPLEQHILDKLNLDYSKFGFLFTNERVVNEIYDPHLRHKYYVVQIADKEVGCIVHFTLENSVLSQGERFGMIRWGSQVDLVIPIENPNYRFVPVIKPLYHVEAGIDKLVEIKKIRKRSR